MTTHLKHPMHRQLIESPVSWTLCDRYPVASWEVFEGHVCTDVLSDVDCEDCIERMATEVEAVITTCQHRNRVALNYRETVCDDCGLRSML